MAAPATARPPLRDITTPNARPLAPIFTLNKRRAAPAASSSSSPDAFVLRTPPTSSPTKHVGSRKRQRARDGESDDDEAKILTTSLTLGKRAVKTRKESDKVASCIRGPPATEAVVESKDATGVTRRPRRRGLTCEAVSTQDYAQGLQSGYRDQGYRSTCSSDTYLASFTHSLLSPHSFLRIPSFRSPNGQAREYAPATTTAMSWAAKTLSTPSAPGGPKRLMAVASEEGTVSLVDVDRELWGDVDDNGVVYGGGMGTGLARESPFLSLHHNAIFDMKWSGDDTRLLTMSADQTSNLHDISGSTPKLLATLCGHTSSVKAGVFFDPQRSAALDAASCPSTVIATAGRDGSILIYDLRCKGWALPDAPLTRAGAASASEGPVVLPVSMIKHAHGQLGKRGSANARTAIRSVTSLLALEGMPGTLASGGSYDGVVKLWDIRFPSARSTSAAAKQPAAANALLSLPDPTIRSGRRQRAIHSLSEDPTTGDIYALAGDSRIHALSPSAEQCYSQTFVHPDLFVSSFYVKSSISRDGRYLAAGSGRGGVVTWDLAQGRAGGQVEGTFLKTRNSLSEVGAVEWGVDILSSSADDLTTRFWRPDPSAARLLREDPSAGAWRYLGASD